MMKNKFKCKIIKSLKTKVQASPFKLLAETYQDTNNMELALNLIEIALMIVPNYPDAMVVKGEILF